jgi:hypothetical protein
LVRASIKDKKLDLALGFHNIVYIAPSNLETISEKVKPKINV